ncbi:tetratricopeptide repeat protein [uncultured Aquimarina sp.]|uniref:tetratricopeptide repeat protein n=1 Tax=uncultured Aquimarina sp. TaxID=575652 RepID=UPI00261D5583|nr:tetratricopeptide repeat protein [uncultured Aquimarina sp.]
MKQLYKIEKTNFQLLILFFILFQHTYGQKNCFTDETLKFHEDSKTQEKSVKWLTAGAEVNHAYSIHSLGLLYVQGNDTIPVDYKKAYVYFEKSACLGIHNSMRSLGIMWEIGEGKKVDLAKAYGWYRLAADFVPTDWDEWHMPRSKVLMFKRMAPKLAKKMTGHQIKAGDEYYEKIKTKVNCDFNSWLRK